jgi:hypothetical protein
VSDDTCGLPVQHAWVTRADEPGEAYEMAWRHHANAAYFGIAFKPEYVRHVFETSGKETYSVLDAWWMDYPLVTGKTAIEEVMWTPTPLWEAPDAIWKPSNDEHAETEQAALDARPDAGRRANAAADGTAARNAEESSDEPADQAAKDGEGPESTR